MRHSIFALWLGLFGCVATFPGCATAPRASPVAVTLANLEAREATAFETRLAVTVRFTNESPEPLALRGSSHKLTLNGRDLGSAVGGETVEVPALSSVSVELPLNLATSPSSPSPAISSATPPRSTRSRAPSTPPRALGAPCASPKPAASTCARWPRHAESTPVRIRAF